MNTKKSEYGFTLIEILVAINLAFITITMIISFYLMFDKLLLSTLKKLEKNITLQTSIYNLNELLKKSDYFSVYPKNDSTFIIFGKSNNIVLTKDNISVKNIYNISNFDNYTLEITSYNGEKDFVIQNGVIRSGSLGNDTTSVIESSEISSLSLIIEMNKQYYRLQYNTPDISSKHFKNLY